MPYIKQEERTKLYLDIEKLSDKIDSWGQLNYVISMLCLNVLEKDIINYERLNSLIGVLESAKLEQYRKLVSKYEDKKAIENGDIFE